MFVKATHPLRTQARRREAAVAFANKKVLFTLTFARERQAFTQKIGQKSARAMSSVGHFRKWWSRSVMSAYKGHL
jgi:hypothetical protein